jgi:hypothetical protein
MLAMLPEITVQLAGRVGRWHPRHVHTQARTVWSAWLHAPQHGILGVYVLAKPNAPLTEALPGNQWVHLRGVLRPLRVLALPDDPRAADDATCAPLLVHAVQIIPARYSDLVPPLLRTPAPAQVRASTGALAPMAHLPDLTSTPIVRGAPCQNARFPRSSDMGTVHLSPSLWLAG